MKGFFSFIASTLLIISALVLTLAHFATRATDIAKADCEKRGGDLILTRDSSICVQKGVVLK